MLPETDIDDEALEYFDIDEDEYYLGPKLPSYTYKVDFEANRIVGNIDEKEALRQAILMMLYTRRKKHIIYSENYGMDFSDLFGEEREYVESELEDRIEEALLEDDRITDVGNFETEYRKGKYHVTCDVGTIFGTIEGLEYETEV